MLIQIPFYVRRWSRAFDAAKRSDWEAVIQSLEPLEGRGVATNESRIWLAEAHARMQGWEQSVAQYERIDRRLSKPEDEARRTYNHAYVLAKVRRVDEATALLERSWDAEWPDDLRAQAERLRGYLREGHVGDLRVLH